MMTKQISAQVIADSVNPVGNRITTFVVTFPRIVLAELNTHRMFSRNSASSRAIPFEKMLKMVTEDPFIPIAWQKDHKGMQGTEYLDTYLLHGTEGQRVVEGPSADWADARLQAIKFAKQMSERGVTKQLCNRLLEPFMWHTAIITATELENFFALRCPQYQHPEFWATAERPLTDKTLYRSKVDYLVAHPEMAKRIRPEFFFKINRGQAEIHIMALAETMWDALTQSIPKPLGHNGWHIPFGDTIELRRVFDEVLKKDIDHSNSSRYNEEVQQAFVKIATARCARVSYLNFEGKDDYEADIKLHDQLLKSGHMSPFEHCAQAMPVEMWSGNFRGFKQYRKTIPGESGTCMTTL